MSLPRATPWIRDRRSHVVDGDRRQTRGPVPVLEMGIRVGALVSPTASTTLTLAGLTERTGEPTASARLPETRVPSVWEGLGGGMSMPWHWRSLLQAVPLLGRLNAG